MDKTLRARFTFRFRHHWPYLLVLPWSVPLTCYLIVGPTYLTSPTAFLGATALMTLMVNRWFWGLNRATSAVVRRFPGLHQTWRRVAANTVVCLVVSASFLVTTVAMFSYLHLFGTSVGVAQFFSTDEVVPQAQAWFSNVLGVHVKRSIVPLFFYAFDLVVLLLMVLGFEAFYLLSQWQASKINYEKRQQAGLQGQLQSLKNQINPHFLFNTLNSLSSLIADEPRRAERFVDEMAKVYRYLLQTNEQELTPLATELAFIDSYYHLLKTRYGAGIHLTVSVEASYLDHRLPPLTLQMLVENAVKHNVILNSRPLRINIESTPAGGLRVRNNLQKKAARVESNHVGLSNIAARYQLLAHAKPLVEAGTEQFAVTVPLLAPVG